MREWHSGRDDCVSRRPTTIILPLYSLFFSSVKKGDRRQGIKIGAHEYANSLCRVVVGVHLESRRGDAYEVFVRDSVLREWIGYAKVGREADLV